MCIQEASPDSVRIALDYYLMPGVPTMTPLRDEVTRQQSLVLRLDDVQQSRNSPRSESNLTGQSFGDNA